MKSGDECEDDNGDGNGNDNGYGGNRNGNPDVNVGGLMPVAHECTYQDFLKCQPLIFKVTEGVVGLTRWTDDEYAMLWKALMKLITEMVPEEDERVEKFIGGLPDNIQGNVITAEPTRLQDAIRIENNLMDQKLKCYAARNAENKRRYENNPRTTMCHNHPLRDKMSVGRMWQGRQG
ncbi:hypothetical protein Tco_1307367 [Tanacetum coccineum]